MASFSRDIDTFSALQIKDDNETSMSHDSMDEDMFSDCCTSCSIPGITDRMDNLDLEMDFASPQSSIANDEPGQYFPITAAARAEIPKVNPRNDEARSVSAQPSRSKRAIPRRSSVQRQANRIAKKYADVCFDEFVGYVSYKGFLIYIMSISRKDENITRAGSEKAWRTLVKSKWRVWRTDQSLQWRTAVLKEAYAQVSRHKFDHQSNLLTRQTFGCPGFSPAEFWTAHESKELWTQSPDPKRSLKVIELNAKDLLLNIETGLLVPHFKKGSGHITDTIQFGTFLIGLDIINGAVLCPAKAAAAWKFFLEVTSHQWSSVEPEEERIAKIRAAHAQVSLYPHSMK